MTKAGFVPLSSYYVLTRMKWLAEERFCEVMYVALLMRRAESGKTSCIPASFRFG